MKRQVVIDQFKKLARERGIEDTIRFFTDIQQMEK